MPRLHRLSRWLLGLLSAGLALILALINSATLNSQGAYPLYFPYIRTHPSPTPRPTPTPQRLPLGWLARVNYYRDTANLPPLSEQPNWSEGNRLHARYMVKNDVIEHDEDPQRPWYTRQGQAAAQSSNLIVSYGVAETDEAAIDGWMTAPFHAIGILDPDLRAVGFGSYREADGGFQMGAGLDVIRGLDYAAPDPVYPVVWPGPGRAVPLTAYAGEYPDPLTHCPGYGSQAGLPILLLAGPGYTHPSVSASIFSQDGRGLEHCLFTGDSYFNPDPDQQDLARSIMTSRDAVVLIPRAPLTPGAVYTVAITVNHQITTWSFSILPTASTPEGGRTPWLGQPQSGRAAR